MPTFVFLLLLFTIFTPPSNLFFFFFNDTATTEIYTLSLHDALPISAQIHGDDGHACRQPALAIWPLETHIDRKSTRLNSSHQIISYAVFCLKKKKENIINISFDDSVQYWR